ncbi:hypothetical protein [Glutamicibacter arilaitensis]|uniref:hypothetical protein n=1 Tax=Glutamicibacter arilaitensis TaxID=256701 RepID=UPI0038502172
MSESSDDRAASSHTYIVTVTATYTARIDQVVSSLEASGLRINKVLGTLGQVIGHGDEELRAQLQQVEGVQSVDDEKVYRLPNPEEPLQ